MNPSRPTDKELAGMSVNERLVVCGVIDEWDDAVRRKCRSDMIKVLLSVAMTDSQAAQTTDAVLQDPKTF